MCKMAESNGEQNSRWLPSSQLSQNEWGEVFLCNWWRGKYELSFLGAYGGNQSWQVWVTLRGKTKRVESQMAQLKLASIIRMSENELVKSFLCKMADSNHSRGQDGCNESSLSQIELVWSFFVQIGGEWKWWVKFSECKWWENQS